MKRMWILLPVLALAFACQNEQEAPETPVAPAAGEKAATVFYATMESQADDTKVHADANLHVLWDANDEVSIFRKNTDNDEYRFTGETDDNAGSFEAVGEVGTPTGTALPYYYAVYPYSQNTEMNADGVITLNLPAEQAYRENSFGLGAGAMVAVSEDNILTFKNVGTFLVIRLYGSGISVSGITLRSNGTEKIAGPATVQMALGGTPSVTMAAEGTSTEIHLSCAEPVALGADAENATAFWFVLPPTTFADGFTITVEDSEGKTYEKSTTKEVVLDRNKQNRMKAFELTPLGFGLYPASGDPYVYNPATDQMNIYEAEGNGWFRFLVPPLTVYELGPIPLDVAAGATLEHVGLTVSTSGAQEREAFYDLTVRSFQSGILNLASADGDQFVIRF